MIYPLTAYEINKLELRRNVLQSIKYHLKYDTNIFIGDQVSTEYKIKNIEIDVEIEEINKTLAGNK